MEEQKIKEIKEIKDILIIPVGINLTIFLFEKIKQLNEEEKSSNSYTSSVTVISTESWVTL